MKEITVLGIESSCDETAVAILRAPVSTGARKAPTLLSSVISTQIALHRQHGGVVPELASRNHSVDLPRVIREACRQAGIEPGQADAYAATSGPGLVAALLVGNTTAKALALTTGKPFIAVNHLEGHMLSPFITSDEGIIPHLALVVSGGHTLYIDVQSFGNYRLLGRSLDDAAGEAFDKVGKMLGLPYPGGPEIDKLAAQGDSGAFNLPRALLKDPGMNVSFSGLKTAVLYTLPKLTPSGNPADLPEQTLCDLCASFQQAVIDTLITKALRGLRSTGHQSLALSGGVSCNQALRNQLQATCNLHGIRLILPSPAFTTDNAAMIAFAGLHHALHGHHHPLDCDVDPNLKLTDESNRSKQDKYIGNH
ncbi:tRNA (adenosine(37)-N6)-threonylcarbamoyltransferase complex transferase subunit TsaD [Akkermansia sp. N21116]|jgi:N6-L-threonylcarbamoyladenine synthase|uniref:tRNA (adenosine(37)-N6)-threonylcarbamoyltransferase complex transferase subunit TsaD n=1 Tax=Akkermansia sp. N21116 TaxID=3040764 RepID=UPI00244EABC0|nr:tRNA (adenosine(37)-N6)-threonylcarbamoyltransferase complex transferase subunit TsaD [Akkermansia sp. N21116]WPX40196.1 tRNA (adenosine(37)-N6)-threonylcarbamoyltransferase complex transferase subunit TsaD [Akkermansia sp. N21116]